MKGKKMKRVITVLMIIMMFTGCAWMGKLTDSTGHNLACYSGGRTMYFAVKSIISTETMTRLEERYDKLLADTTDVVIVEPNQSMEYFNDTVAILLTETDNPYGLVGDLAYILEQFGAEYNDDGNMTGIQPVPRSLYLSFSRGWRNSKIFDEME
jgi:hypothetical protein